MTGRPPRSQYVWLIRLTRKWMKRGQLLNQDAHNFDNLYVQRKHLNMLFKYSSSNVMTRLTFFRQFTCDNSPFGSCLRLEMTKLIPWETRQLGVCNSRLILMTIRCFTGECVGGWTTDYIGRLVKSLTDSNLWVTSLQGNNSLIARFQFLQQLHATGFKMR